MCTGQHNVFCLRSVLIFYSHPFAVETTMKRENKNKAARKRRNADIPPLPFNLISAVVVFQGVKAARVVIVEQERKEEPSYLIFL